MNYPSGDEVRVGDKLELWMGCSGVVVASMDSESYSDSYPESEWAYLQHGILVVTEQVGLLHYTNPEPTMRLLDRGATRK